MTAAFKPFAARERQKDLLARHFRALAGARAEGRKVAWVSSMGPVELLRSFGFEVHLPENHGALLGATRTANLCIPAATAAGYSPDVCSYLTADVGAFLTGRTPLAEAYGIGEVPRPDVLVFNTNQCRDVQDWFAFYARRFGVPLAGIYSPIVVNDVTDDLVRLAAAQYRGLLPVLEAVSGKRFDEARLAEAVALSAKASGLWNEVLDACRARPTPFTFFDGAIHMAPAVLLRGLPEAVDYYRLLLDEVRERVRGGVGAVEGERYRLYWDGMPIWGKLRELSGFLAEAGAAVVASTYCSAWVFPALDPANPLESMARAYLELFNSRSDAVKERVLLDLCRRFEVDGVLFHEAKTCPNNSNTRYGLPRRLRELGGPPSAILYGDLNDLRCYSEEQTKTVIEAFLEQLDAAGSGRNP